MFSSANFNLDQLERKKRIGLSVFKFMVMLFVCIWVTRHLSVVCVADVSVVCVPASSQYVLSLGFGWTCKKEQQQPRLSV